MRLNANTSTHGEVFALDTQRRCWSPAGLTKFPKLRGVGTGEISATTTTEAERGYARGRLCQAILVGGDTRNNPPMSRSQNIRATRDFIRHCGRSWRMAPLVSVTALSPRLAPFRIIRARCDLSYHSPNHIR